MSVNHVFDDWYMTKSDRITLGRGGGEFAMPRTHGQIAGDDDRIRPVHAHLLRKPVERGAVFGAEMDVAAVE